MTIIDDTTDTLINRDPNDFVAEPPTVQTEPKKIKFETIYLILICIFLLWFFVSVVKLNKN